MRHLSFLNNSLTVLLSLKEKAVLNVKVFLGGVIVYFNDMVYPRIYTFSI